MTLLEKTLQTVGEARLTVGVNDDDIQAGYNNTGASQNAAGGFLSYPAGASLGSMKWYASNNAGNYAIQHTNASFGQATNFVIHDPVNANAVYLIGAGATPFVNGNIPVASGTNGLMADSGVALANCQPYFIQVTLTAAQVLAAYATPQLILAPPGAGKTILCVAPRVITEVSTAFAGGGVAVVQYGNTAAGAGTNALSATIPSTEITAATSQIYTMSGYTATTVSTGITNLGIYFSNQTGAFTGGAGSTISIAFQYLVVTATV